MPLDPQVSTLLQTMNDPEAPPAHTLPLETIRQLVDTVGTMGGEVVPLADIKDLTIPGPAGALPIRVYTPSRQKSLPMLLFIHGGGWTTGSIEGYDRLCRHLAAQSGSLVVSVGYRLAPEHPFPAGLDDCYTAAMWLAENAASINGDATRLAIGGDSAGGNLSTVVTLLAKERGGPQLRYQVLLQPMTDYYEPGTPSLWENAEGYFLTREAVIWFWQHYIPDTSKALTPYAAPLRAKSLAGLPPALIITAEYDPLRDEGEQYASRLQEAGVPIILKRFDGMIHPFMLMAGSLAQGKAAIYFTAKQLRTALESKAKPLGL
ncbi:alpha/beta hydrolase [Ktedonospora formicarum]|uniref:Putative lipase/esterase n=1 Tax=Ktedonospora formicarum TaxID=2778364 RepID=A0A8J3IB13_9CHLR|nr:alpha/beta hydrolase [Ktedonospora formicarum]GHO50716.1 putative lipase/esterase [Ktedonospora formicarum]